VADVGNGGDAENASKSQSATDQLSVSPDGFALSLSNGDVIANPKSLFTRLSFTHIVQLLQLDDNLQRAFYAIEAMRGPWSVRELKRQIDTNYYARSGWSRKPELLAQKLKETLAAPSFKDDIKSPYFRQLKETDKSPTLVRTKQAGIKTKRPTRRCIRQVGRYLIE
jgi:hypothetical protein